MHRNTVICTGLTDEEAASAIQDMLGEFAERPWQEDVSCEWKDGVLRLSASNDVDSTGLALLDEFTDAVFAYINFSGDIHFKVESTKDL